jgi:hypothetical protein
MFQQHLDKSSSSYSARSPDSKDPGRIQILHYNLERFPYEITDMRGLETLLVTT